MNKSNWSISNRQSINQSISNQSTMRARVGQMATSVPPPSNLSWCMPSQNRIYCHHLRFRTCTTATRTTDGHTFFWGFPYPVLPSVLRSTGHIPSTSLSCLQTDGVGPSAFESQDSRDFECSFHPSHGGFSIKAEIKRWAMWSNIFDWLSTASVRSRC
jgi:hypothetical protein